MKKTIPLHLLLATFALCGAKGGPSEAPAQPATRVYYFNMGANTFAGITPSTIEDCYDLTSALKYDVGKVLEEIDKDKLPGREFDDNEVRLKIVPPKGDAVLCNLWQQVKVGRKRYKLSRASYEKVHRMILDALPDG